MRTKNPNRVSLILVLAIVSLGMVWVVVAKLTVPALIASAYRGESLPIFNRMISGQASHALAEYLATWDQLAWIILLVFFVIGLVIVGIVHPEFQAAFWAPAETMDKDSLIAPMARQRVLLIYSLSAIILGGSLFDLITDTEQWPFSQYPMYSAAEKSRSLTVLRLFGVTAEKPQVEIPLIQFQYMQPFDSARLQTALQFIYAHRNDQLSEAVRDCLVRYEALRRVGLHNGPRLQAIRLYRVYWVLDPWARNIDHPDRKDLLVEVRESGDTETLK